MPKNKTIPRIPVPIRRRLLAFAGRPGGIQRAEVFQRFAAELAAHGSTQCVWRAWAGQLVAERVARLVGRGRATTLVTTAARKGPIRSLIPAM